MATPPFTASRDRLVGPRLSAATAMQLVAMLECRYHECERADHRGDKHHDHEPDFRHLVPVVSQIFHFSSGAKNSLLRST
jgi:hypothetical protein